MTKNEAYALGWAEGLRIIAATTLKELETQGPPPEWMNDLDLAMEYQRGMDEAIRADYDLTLPDVNDPTTWQRTKKKQ